MSSSSDNNVQPDDQEELTQTNVSKFLQRLEDLKQAAGSDDKDRARRLEEEIDEAKRQRIARRQARSRSISPEKFEVNPSTTNRPLSKSGVTSRKELKSTYLSYETHPSLSPTTAVADPAVDVPETSPSEFSTHGIPASNLRRDSPSVRNTPSSPALKVSAPLALKSDVPTMEKIKMWERSAETVQAAEKGGDEPIDDNESRSKKGNERSNLSHSQAETSAELSRESESSSSPVATEVSAQSDAAIINSKRAPLHARYTVSDQARKENDGVSTLSRSTSRLTLSPSSNVPSSARSEANVDKEKESSNREEERLSKFLRPASQLSSTKDRLHGNDAPYLPSPSNTQNRAGSCSPTLSQINEQRMESHIAEHSISRSPERSPARGSQSPFRSNRYSGIGTFASSDFYNEGAISPASFELGLKNLPGALDLRRSDSARSSGSVASNDISCFESPGMRSPSPTRPKSPTKVGFVQSAMLKRDGSRSPTKRLSMSNFRPAPAVLNSSGSSPLQKSHEWQGACSQESDPILSTGSDSQESTAEKRTEHDKPLPEQNDNQPSLKSEPEVKKVDRGQSQTQPSKPTTPVPHTADNSTSPNRIRHSSSLHRSASSLTMARSAVERFRSQDLDLTARYDKERDNSIVSQYSQSNFKPSPTNRSLLDIYSEEENGVTVRPPRGPKPDQIEIHEEAEDSACRVTGDESNKENLVTDGSSPRTDTVKTPTRSGSREPTTPTSPLLSRSPSRSKNNKRWTPSPNKSSWLETALMKTGGGASMRVPAARSPKDVFS
ncbi:hypothetical protein V1509DRAFT_665125 [Lipomyces kononenkoae]